MIRALRREQQEHIRPLDHGVGQAKGRQPRKLPAERQIACPARFQRSSHTKTEKGESIYEVNSYHSPRLGKP